MKLSIIMAMQQEAAGAISLLGLKRDFPNSKYEALQLRFFTGQLGQLQITLTIPGLDPRFKMDSIGTEPAAVATFATIMEYAPDLLLNAGTCGSFASAGAELGKVYLSDSKFFFHDHRIPLPGWREYGLGAYASLNVRALAARLKLPTANISSGNSLDYTEDELTAIKASGAILKEMEAAAIAWVAFITGTPFFALKSVTNLIDTNPDSPAEFEKNFSFAVSRLNVKLKELVKELAEMDLGAALARGSLG